jgi:hypothetical protein
MPEIAKAVKARTTNPPIQPKTSLATHEESLFIEPNDYCTIRYQGHVASLKSTRGLHYLAVLLRDPDGSSKQRIACPPLAHNSGAGIAVPDGIAGGLLPIPSVDAQAKAAKRRINELQEELASRGFNDAQRKTEIQNGYRRLRQSRLRGRTQREGPHGFFRRRTSTLCRDLMF